jgi:hypothetical protein
MMNPMKKKYCHKPLHCSRKNFLAAMAAAAISTVAASGKKRELDDNLILLLADCHVAAGGGTGSFAYRRLQYCIDSALSLERIPRRAFVFGDIAGTVGPKEDYELSAIQFRRLEDAGVEVSYMMGNHDRRAGFLAVHPECAAKSPVPGRLVQVVETPACDFIILDSLIGEDGDEKIVVRGALDPVQAEWLEATVSKGDKPAIVCAHHACDELKTAKGKSLHKFLPYIPRVRGFIHGHIHRWYHEWQRRFDGDGRFMRRLSLPATGNWGDLGYCMLQFTPEKTAEVRLFQNDYCYPKPVSAEKRPRAWDMIVSDNHNLVCTFDLG